MNFNNKKHNLLLVSVLMLVTLSCSTNTKKAEAVEEVKEETLEAKKELEGAYNEAIESLDMKISDLESELENASEDATQSLTVTINELKQQRQKLFKELTQITESSEEKWDELKVDSKEVLTEYQAKLDSLSLSAEETMN